MTEQANRRRSERVVLRMAVLVLAENEERRQIHESFLLTNPAKNMEISCRVVRIEEDGLEFYNIAFEFDRPAPTFWPVVFPPADWAPVPVS